MNSLTFFKNLKLNRGFTLVELVVVMSIAVIMITTLVVQQNKWNDSLTVNTQAYELALMIRQAQIYSLGVRESAPGSGNFDIGYGVYFDSNNSRYIYFADKNGDKKYNAGEEIEIKTLTNGVTVDRFCGVKDVGQLDDKCSSGSGNVAYLNISFFRPEPKANILLLNNRGNQSGNTIPPATIYLKSLGGNQYSVKVEANGQVSVTQI